MAIEDIRNFVSLSEHLATAGQPSEQQVEELARAGFEVAVSLGLLDPRYCLADEAELIGSLGIAYHHIPVDFKAPQFDDLTKFFSVMDGSRDKKLFIHCAANYRLSAFLALYGQAKLGWSVSQADAHIRRVWEPNDTWKEFIEAFRRNDMTPNKKTVEAYMDGFRTTDRPQILSCLTDDVEWVLPGAFHVHGKHDFAKHIVDEGFSGHPVITVSRMMEEGDVVVAEGSVRAPRQDGVFLDLVFCDVFDMRNGKIRRLVSYLMQTK